MSSQIPQLIDALYDAFNAGKFVRVRDSNFVGTIVRISGADGAWRVRISLAGTPDHQITVEYDELEVTFDPPSRSP